MRAVMLQVPDHLIAERKRLGQDRFDEMWEGELHMVPPPNREHQEIGTRLLVQFVSAADRLGLRAGYEMGLFDPSITTDASYRQPDLIVYDESAGSDRGVEGRARLVVEIRSPGDETFEKLPFYERVGVLEVLVIDRDTKALRRWVRHNEQLDEVATADAAHALEALPITLRTDGGRLVVTADGRDTVI